MSPGERTGLRCLRVMHFLLARSGLFMAIFLLCLLSERANREKQPPIHPWIIYLHAGVYLVTSTGMSARLLPSASVFVASVFYLHLAYIFMFEPKMDYVPWLRLRAALRLAALAGASIRMLSAGSFSVAKWRDKLANILSGCVCALLGLLSLPMTLTHVDKAAQHQELSSAFPQVFVSNFIHWVIGVSFLLAFLAYTFPVLVILPSGNSENPTFSTLVSWADRLTCVAWTLTLVCKDLNWRYWQAQGVDFWLQNLFLLMEVLIIVSIIVGVSLPWLSEVVVPPDRRKKDN
ncbi:unnamed protein product [Mesocestoides corti]|uniref:Uncharacterized protein n=2 Tax=Mesocestoides corti TaxID=53468 RepID=A0A3P6HCW5_MESCO|nr:unnamed protein product [Mesocestoides corti]